MTEDEGDADTTAQLRAMRSVWLSMRDEDPPDGGLVDLLSAARAKAATMRARPTLRQRLLAWVRRPPALAFATVVILVGGAVLVLGRSSGHHASELAAGSSGVLAERAGPSPSEPEEVSAPAAMPTAPAKLPAAMPVSPARTATRAIPTAPEMTSAPEIPALAAKRERAKVADAPAPALGTSAAPPESVGMRDGDADDDDEGMDIHAAPGVEIAKRSSAGRKQAEAEPAKQLDRLYKQCASAARRGDCAAVRAMVGKIAKTDHGYRARVAKDAAVARCLANANAADALAE